MAKLKEFQNKNNEELLKALKEKQNELLEFKFGKAVRSVKNTAQAKFAKKDIARILTALNAKNK